MKDPKKITIESYDATAKEYAQLVAGMFLKNEIEIFVSHLSKNSLILDLGCGSGRDAKIFTEKGYRVIGIDLSKKLLEIAQRTAPKAEFRLMDILKLDFPDNYFDGIWAAGSLPHIPKKDIPAAITQIHRVLKKGRILFISLKEGEGEILKEDKRYKEIEKFWSFFKQEEIENYLKKENFRILSSDITKDENSYATNPWIEIFCEK